MQAPARVSLMDQNGKMRPLCVDAAGHVYHSDLLILAVMGLNGILMLSLFDGLGMALYSWFVMVELGGLRDASFRSWDVKNTMSFQLDTVKSF